MTANPSKSSPIRIVTSRARASSMELFRISRNSLRCFAALGLLSTCIDGAEIPFPEVLDKAAVVQEKITDIDREGLVIGNGDLSGILWQRDGGLCLRVTKNDVWDARVDTSRDPALMTVDIPNQKWSGGTGSPHSYQNPYRMAYFLRCFSKPGVNPAGLWGVLPNDTPQWHGDYHHNYNAWQPFWSAMILNQPGLAEPWIDCMNRMLPRLRWLAKTTYGCEGAFVGISSFAFEPDPAASTSVNKRQSMLTPWGYTMGMIGMSAQVLWHHHLYQPDRKYLESKIWPVLRDAALFFASFAEKCPRDATGKAVYGPSYSPEHGSFGVSNVPFDLAYARFTLKAAIRAAGELGEKSDPSNRFRAALEMLPAYPTAPDAQGRPVVVDWTGCRFGEIDEHNITVPAVPVFPGEQVTWFSPGPEKDLFLNTMRQIRHRGANSTVDGRLRFVNPWTGRITEHDAVAGRTLSFTP